MSGHTPAAVVALTALLVVGLLFPAGSAAGVFAGQSDAGAVGQQGTDTQVSVEVGEQLSTVVETTSSDVRTEAESVGFEQRLAAANATERAALIAERARALKNNSVELRSEYERLTDAYQQGNVTTSQYARQIAALSASATNVERSVTQLQQRASTLSAAERRGVDVTDDDLAEVTSGINPLTGPTASAVLGRFTGENSGEISIEVGERIEVSVESDGERSRQYEQPRDDDDSYIINQSAALATAKAQLSGGPDVWALRGVSTEDGAYEFEFRYLGTGEGEAEVAVDGSSGTVFSLEESVEAPEDDDEYDEDERKDEQLEDLVVRVLSGEPTPGSNVTLRVLGAGEPVENATVRINEQAVGTTGADGRLQVTFPEGEEVEIVATAGEAEGELEFEYEDDEERELGATASIDGQTITVTVVRGGQPLEGATVTLNENATQTTGPDGQASFEFSEAELEITIQYDDQEAELEYELEETEDDEDEEEREDSEDEVDEDDDSEADDTGDDEEREGESDDEKEEDDKEEGDGEETDEEENEEDSEETEDSADRDTEDGKETNETDEDDELTEEEDSGETEDDGETDDG